MKTKLRNKPDQVELLMESSFRPGTFIRDGECFTFVSGLEEVATIIDKLVAVEPARAVALYEAFLAGCHAKADELDDSSGSFGQFARDLICRWIKSHQAADVDPRMTASTLLAWMDDDPYGFCYQIQKDAIAAFDKAGLAAFEKQIRERFDTVSADPIQLGVPARSRDFARDLYRATGHRGVHCADRADET